jgi:asparagine synthase (glutamine-hydrolysing)
MYRSLLSVWQQPASLMSAEFAEDSDFGTQGWDDSDLLRSMMRADQMVYLPDDLLAKVDRASMAVSLEARAPLLDYRVVEASWRLEREQLVERGVGKQLLRTLLYRYVPRELVDRPKMGFSVPVAEWLNGPLRQMASDLLTRDAVTSFGVISADAAQREWTRFLAGERANATGLWTLMMFQAWCNRWLASARPRPAGSVTH